MIGLERKGRTIACIVCVFLYCLCCWNNFPGTVYKYHFLLIIHLHPYTFDIQLRDKLCRDFQSQFLIISPPPNNLPISSHLIKTARCTTSKATLA